jgi:competence protein ComEC
LSHSDADHVGGASSVLGAFTASYKSAGVQIDASFTPDQLPIPLPASSASHLPWRRCEAGQRWVQDGVQFDVLHPTPDLYQRQPPLSTNDASCVLWVRGRSASVLLTGDLSARFEAALVASQPDLRATLLMAPHHGSKTSSSLSFLQTVQPEWVFIQAGYRNRYNHPAPEVMARYQALGLRTRATANCGAIRWQSTDRTPTCHRDLERHHWHWQAPTPALPHLERE